MNEETHVVEMDPYIRGQDQPSMSQTPGGWIQLWVSGGEETPLG